MNIGSRCYLYQRYQSEDDSRSSTMETRAQARKEKEVMEDPLGLRVEKLENKIAEQNSKMTKHIAEMFEAIHLFSTSGPSNQADVHHQFRSAPASASFSPAPEFGKRSGNSNIYAGVTRLAKLDFPRFNGDKIKEWLFQVEQFFEIDHTPDDLKISLASGHFDDLAATWHQWMVKSVLWKHVMHNWMTYKMLLQGRFKELEVDPIVELTQLQETDGIDEYHGRFELISSRVKLPEENLVSAYLDGLRLDTQTHIKMFQPQSIQQCLLVGRLYEFAHPMKSSTSSDAKQLIQQESYVGVKKLLQHHEAICATKSFLEAYSNSELESESPDSKMETDCVAQPQVSISVMEPSHQHKLLDDLDMHMVIEDQQPVVADENVPPTRVIRRTVSVDYQKGVQLFDLFSNAAGTSLSNLVEKKIKKDLVEVDVAKFGDDDQFSDAGEVFGFNIEASKTESSNQERLKFPTKNNGCLDHFQSMVLMKEEPKSVKINEVKLETHSCNLAPDLIQAKMMVTKANSLCNDASVYVLEDLSSTTLRNNQSKLYCGLDGDALQSGGVFKFWKFTDFDIIPLGRQVLTKGRKKTSYKSRRFKFKHRVVPRGDVTLEEKREIDETNTHVKAGVRSVAVANSTRPAKVYSW